MHSRNATDRRLSTGLAWFSLGLGLTELFAPRMLSRAIGLKPRPKMMRALGIREIATGVGMLSKPRSALGPRARVAGDVMDLAVLATSPRSRRGAMSPGLITAVVAVAAVAAVDLYASRRLARHRPRHPVVNPPAEDEARMPARESEFLDVRGSDPDQPVTAH